MRSGFFIHDNVRDPTILSSIEPHKCVVIFVRLPSGFDYYRFEFLYNATEHHVVNQATVPPGQTRAAFLLGIDLSQDVALVAAFQRSTNEHLTTLPRNLLGNIVEDVIVHLSTYIRV